MSTPKRCRWFAAGKHPCARDFFTIGESFPLAESLHRWVAAGYQPRRPGNPCRRSWRFWAGVGETVVYGIINDSCDSLGRPFPLLVIGQERGKGWEMAWEALPQALAESWACMEAIASSVLPDLSALRTRICGEGLERVAPRWPAFPAAAVEGASGMENLIEAALRRDATLVSLSHGAQGPPDVNIAAASHAALKQKLQKAPGSVFIGGLIHNPRILFFYRPLAASDFSRLWQADPGAEGGAK